ncbi:Pyruvate dehydrogenase complex component E2 1 [Rhizophlyctis rosea]|uniref:Pyruvate dehydrogenase complex component E2 1 n=1 Tax=Rhizophlyctis rosea TaxID=64517 RepID=A0AAD5SL57_9FUNG|nr:Pyruvate dehydrogenase complex component E2 1 [Rhizophlyctis rosea]
MSLYLSYRRQAMIPRTVIRTCAPLRRQVCHRSASTSAHGTEVFSPAVSFLLHSKHIPTDVIARIPRSGPKNRLLKGDVLKFLSDPSFADSVGISAEEEEVLTSLAYYSKEIIVNDALSLTKALNEGRNAGVTISDFFTRATSFALQTVPEVNARWNSNKKSREVLEESQISVSRVSPFGVSTALLEKHADLGAVKIAKTFKDQGEAARSARGAFSVYDHIQYPEGDITPYLSSSQTGILTIHPIRKISPSSSPAKSDIFDILVGSSTRSGHLAPPAEKPIAAKPASLKTSSRFDEIDFFAQPTRNSVQTGNEALDYTAKYIVKVDLTVDSRAVPAKVAEKFLKEFEASIVTRTKKLV